MNYFVFFFAGFLQYALSANVAVPITVYFNSTHYFGYDGPWQAIPVLVSQPQQLVNLYPGGTYATCIPSINVRNYLGNYTSDDFPSDPGIFDLSLAHPEYSASSTQNYYFFGPSQSGTIGAVDGSVNGGEAAGLGGKGLIVTDRLEVGGATVSNVTISAVYQANYTLPDGQGYPLDVGFLSLGAANNQFFDNMMGYMVPLNLSATGVIPSNTWGLHIGSVSPSVPGSLVLGGYDRSRVIGNVSALTTQNVLSDMIISLLDINIGVAEGGSPFPFTSKSGLLVNSQNTVQPVNVRPNPTVPYLYLPGDTCKAITSNLPVRYMNNLDLYIWDTSSPDYEKIITSPSYLGFTFQLLGDQGNLTINVPFSLLNLTLTAPLVDGPTPYFPCKSYSPLGPSSTPGNEYHLGRAFLQAAFIGMNWHNTVWWMAQGPGPNSLTPDMRSLDNSTSTIESVADSSLWIKSWSGVWTPLPGGDRGQNSSTNGNNSDNGGSGDSRLSTGSKAGIGVGSAAGALIILGAAFYFFRRSKKAKKSPITSQDISGMVQKGGEDPKSTVFVSDSPRSNWQRQELEDTSRFSRTQLP